MRGNKKHEWVPYSLVKHIERKMKEIDKQHPTRIEAMNMIAKELDTFVIKKRRKNE